MLFVLPYMQRRQEAKNAYIEADSKDDHGFPEIVEEDDGFDPDENQQMTMEARALKTTWSY